MTAPEELSCNKVYGLVGFGAIARYVAKLVKAFGVPELSPMINTPTMRKLRSWALKS